MRGTAVRSAVRGSLELTWTNKNKRLLAYEDGSYVWVSPSDYRVAEVRLLDEAGKLGNVGPPDRTLVSLTRLAVCGFDRPFA